MTTNISTDLPKIPCFDSTFCKDIYNCAPNSSIYDCPIQSQNSANSPSCGSPNLIRNPCFGSDSSYCSGILQECDPAKGYYCKPGTTNPAVNYFSEYLGCDVLNDPGCMEFDKDMLCQNDCWDLGGKIEVKHACESLFSDKNNCNSMKYFCEWNDFTNKCTSTKDDPWNNFLKGPSTNNYPKLIFTETINGNKLNCAQSSWSSNQITSYAHNIRTCCIDGTDKCITTPRCQFVENTCDCGFKDISYSNNPTYNENSSNNENDVKYPYFICQDVQQNIATNDQSIVKKGYCTWCKGTQLHNFDYRNWLISNEILSPGSNVRNSDAWGTSDNCVNRCSNYNKCENDQSEKLWNECIWRNSNGKHGINPEAVVNSNYSRGFCYNKQCTNNNNGECKELNELKNVCESELYDKVITLNQLYPITVNDGIPSPRCTNGTTWTHNCTVNNSTKIAENYACGWCPNLQNDWPENPCTKVENETILKWYNPLKIFGVQDENGAIAAIILIVIIGLVLLGILIWALYLILPLIIRLAKSH